MKKLTQTMPLLSPKEVLHLVELNQDIKAPNDTDSDWLEAEGIKLFMSGQPYTLTFSLVTVVILAAVINGYVNSIGLWLWVAVSVASIWYRFSIARNFQKMLPSWTNENILVFCKKYAWVWPFAGALWGALVWLFYAKSPNLNQSITWIVLICVGVFGSTSYAGHLKALKCFINALVMTSLMGMFWISFISPNPAVMSETITLVPLIVLFWVMLLSQGNRLTEAFRQRVILLKRNAVLIDSLKAQTDRAVTAIAMKNRLLASAAHDIRQPVLALDLYAGMLRDAPETSPTLTPKIAAATRSVIAMFDGLFDLARLETAQIQISKSHIDVAAFMDELLLQYEPSAHAKGLELRMRSCQADIYSDPQLLKRSIGNLIANAIKFTEKNGVLLACRKTHNGLRFEVWDTGMGITPEQQKAVFQEFYKAPLNTKASIGTNEGFGLGLFIVARFCEALGHTISMRSELGKGSVFRITVAVNPADVHKK